MYLILTKTNVLDHLKAEILSLAKIVKGLYDITESNYKIYGTVSEIINNCLTFVLLTLEC